jgi:rubrerythrin
MKNFKEYCLTRKEKSLFEGVADNLDALMQGNKTNVNYRALRISMMAEIDAVNLYERLAEVVTNPKIKEVLLDVAREEKVHIGEFEQLLDSLDPNFKKSKEEGKQEATNKKPRRP